MENTAGKIIRVGVGLVLISVGCFFLIGKVTLGKS